MTAMSDLLGHGDGGTGVHMTNASLWALISTIAFAIFLLMIAWTLVRPNRDSRDETADALTERYAHGELSDDEFTQLLSIIRSRKR